MAIQNITTGVQTVVAAGAVTGSLDTSAITGDFTVKVRVSGLEAGKTAIIAVQDTANATPFSEAVDVAIKHVTGPKTEVTDLVFNFRKYELPGIRIGAANNKLRINVLSLTAAANLKVYAYLEQ